MTLYYKLTAFNFTSVYVNERIALTYKVGVTVRPKIENSFIFFYAYPEVVGYQEKISNDFLNKQFIVRVTPKEPIPEKRLFFHDYYGRAVTPCLNNNGIDDLDIYWSFVHATMKELGTDLQDKQSAREFRMEFNRRYFHDPTFGQNYYDFNTNIVYVADTYYNEPRCFLARELEVLFIETPETYARDMVRGAGWDMAR